MWKVINLGRKNPVDFFQHLIKTETLLRAVPCSNASFDFGFEVCGRVLRTVRVRGGSPGGSDSGSSGGSGSASGCLSACLEEPRCQFWTFHPDGDEEEEEAGRGRTGAGEIEKHCLTKL